MANKKDDRQSNGKILRYDDVITKLPCPPLRPSLAPSSVIDRSDHLRLLPAEMFFKILFYVPPMELITRGRLVCKYWLCIIDSQIFWRLKCQEEEGEAIAYPEVNSHDNPFPLDFRCIYLKRPFNRNLADNWNVAARSYFWVDALGEDGLIGSVQTIDLLAEGCTREMLDLLKPTIELSEWTAATSFSGSRYFVEVTLLSSEGEILDRFKSETKTDQLVDMSWNMVSHKFCNYPAGVRYVKFLHGGKGRRIAAGYVGRQITTTCIIVSPK